MSPKKSTDNGPAAQIKKDMVDYIGPVFQELKGDIKELRTEIKELKVDNSKLHKRIDGLATEVGHVATETRQIGITVDEMRKEILTALEASSSVLQHEEIVKEQGERIDDLERDVRVLKAVRSPKL